MTPPPLAPPLPAPGAPRFQVEMREGAPRPFADIVAAKRFLDRRDDALRCVRVADGELMARKARVSDAELRGLAALFERGA